VNGVYSQALSLPFKPFLLNLVCAYAKRFKEHSVLIQSDTICDKMLRGDIVMCIDVETHVPCFTAALLNQDICVSHVVCEVHFMH
jgi:hypothetical protein